MHDIAPFSQLVEHPWAAAPTLSSGGSIRASVVATAGSSSSGLTVPETRQDFALVCGASKAYLVGGQASAGQSPTGEPRPCCDACEFSFATRTWSALPPLPVPITQAKGVASEDDFVFVVGGWRGDGYSGDVWLLAPRDHPSLQPVPDENSATDAAAATANETALRSEKKLRGAAKDVGESKLCWRLLQPPVDVHGRVHPHPSPRIGHTLVKAVLPTTSHAQEETMVLYLFGGFDGERWLNDVWRLHVTPSLRRREAVWEQLSLSGRGAMSSPVPRSDAAVAFDGVLQRLFVCFGQTRGTLLNDVWELDITTCEWRALTTAGTVSPRSGAVAVVPDGTHLYVLAGQGEVQQCIPQLLRLDLLDYKWHLIAPARTEKLLSGRHRFVATGGSAGERGGLVFGGVGSANALVELVLDPTMLMEAPAKRK